MTERSESVKEDARAEVPGVERLLSLSDGVVAIAITLIIFQLHVPSIQHADSASELVSSLASTGGELATYVLAFAVIAQFWLAHHRTFRHIRGHDEGLAWLNFFFLFTISVMPFTSNLIGRYSDNPVAIDIFSLNIALASLSTAAVMLYGRRKDLLLPSVRTEDLQRGFARGGAVILITAASAAVAWVSTTIAKDLWFLLFVIPAVNTRFLLPWVNRRRP